MKILINDETAKALISAGLAEEVIDEVIVDTDGQFSEPENIDKVEVQEAQDMSPFLVNHEESEESICFEKCPCYRRVCSSISDVDLRSTSHPVETHASIEENEIPYGDRSQKAWDAVYGKNSNDRLKTALAMRNKEV